jgi:integrase/recombinase XerD
VNVAPYRSGRGLSLPSAGVDDAPVLAGAVLTPAQELVGRFLLTKRSGNTRSAYGSDLGVRVLRPGVEKPGPPRPARSLSWLAWCDLIGVDPVTDVAEEYVAAWARQMDAAGLAPATRARRLSAVSSWYAWLVRHRYLAANPAEFVDRPYVDPDVSKTPGLTKEQAVALLTYADAATTPAAARNAALAYLIIFTGARIGSLTGADEGHIGIDRGHRVLWITGKGGAQYPLVIPPIAWQRVDAYLASRPILPQLPVAAGASPAPPRPGRPLLETESGKRLRDAAAWVIMRQLASSAGLPKELVRKFGCHGGRHTFATLSLLFGVPLADLQDAMGHKDPRTTRRYAKAIGRLERAPGYALASHLAPGPEVNAR